MIYSNKKKMYEVPTRQNKELLVYPVGASCLEEAHDIVMGRYGVDRRNIIVEG
jgi:hypothetical protein